MEMRRSMCGNEEEHAWRCGGSIRGNEEKHAWK
jgi:hypothetical protein